MSWTKQFSKSKQKYYWFNKDTGKSSWDDPSKSWTKQYSKTFKKNFWFNSVTGESSWKNPNELETNSKEVENEEKLESSSPKKSLLSPEPVTDSRKLRNDRIRRLLIERVRRKKKEAELEESKKPTQKVESLSESLEKLNIEDNNKDKEKEKEKNNSIDLKKPTQKPSRSHHSSSTRTIEIQNGMGIYHSFDAPSHWDSEDIREYMRDISDSMGPYA